MTRFHGWTGVDTHAAESDAVAIRLYESIGFAVRRSSTILVVRSPGTSGAARAL